MPPHTEVRRRPTGRRTAPTRTAPTRTAPTRTALACRALLTGSAFGLLAACSGEPSTPLASPSLTAFTAQSGIPVTFSEPITDNTEYVASIEGPLSSGADVGVDVLTLTSWMCARLARADELQPFGPVAADQVMSALARPDWDRDQTLSMPWQAPVRLIAIGYGAGADIEALTAMADITGGMAVQGVTQDQVSSLASTALATR